MSYRDVPTQDAALAAFLRNLRDDVTRLQTGGAIKGEISLAPEIRIGDVRVVTADGAGDDRTLTFVNAITGDTVAPAGSGARRVSALPASPTDGDLIEYVDTASGADWLLIYHAGDGLWHCVAGGAIYGYVAADENNGSAVNSTYFAFASGPQVTVPLAGLYELQMFSNVYGANGALTTIALSLAGAAPAAAEAAGIQTVTGAAATPMSIARVGMYRSLAAGEVLLMEQQATNNAPSGHYAERVVKALPVTLTP